MRILHIDSSISGATGASGRLSASIVARLLQNAPDAEVVRRDLAADPLPLLDAPIFAQPVDPAAQSPGLRSQVVAEFLSADVVVIGAPMYNFGIPAQLKTWIDYLAVAGVTFAYTPQGPQGLAGGRKVYIASARGGIYSAGSPAAGLDHQEAYLQAVFAFLGVQDLTVFRAEGLALGPDQATEAFARIEAEIAAIPA